MQRRQMLGMGAGATAVLGLGGCSLRAGSPRESDLDTPRQIRTGRNHPVAWVLSSGGPRGFVHIGVIKALLELGLRPDLVVGSSVGALVGSLLASGVSAGELEALALETSLTRLFRLNLWGPGWVNAEGLSDLVNTLARGRRLQDFPTAFAAAAIEQGTDALVGFNWGDAGWAVHAACAMEGRLAPVRVGRRWYLDADRVSPLPVRLARQLGAQRVLAIDASAHEDRAPPGSEAWRAQDLRKRAATQADAVHADLVLHPEFGYYTGASQAYRQATLAAGYRQTLEQAQALQKLHRRP